MGKRLIIMRHAKSSWTSGAPTDHQRPLSKRGRRARMTTANAALLESAADDWAKAMRADWTPVGGPAAEGALSDPSKLGPAFNVHRRPVTFDRTRNR